MTRRRSLRLSILLALATAGGAAVVEVDTTAELTAAIAAATPGTTIRVAAGTYAGGIYRANMQGTAAQPIIIAGADPASPPVIAGGGNCLQLSDAAHVELRDLVFQGGTDNGINLDDNSTFDSPAHDIALVRVTVRDVGPTGNRDTLKMSGVDRFRIQECRFERWGDGGSGIDMVGCHDGEITGSTFIHTSDTIGANGLQTKGGTARIAIRSCRFEHAGSRALMLGGSTGFAFFRPQPPGPAEGADILVERCEIIGSQAPIAFVGSDRCIVRFNTFYRPRGWAMRILQETVDPAFVPCRNGTFTDNIIAYRGTEMGSTVNIGPNTEPASFTFARNWWFRLDGTTAPPGLPTPETDGHVGTDPMLIDPENGNLGTQPASPARGAGASAPVPPSGSGASTESSDCGFGASLAVLAVLIGRRRG